jgi:hypothetical protein
MMVRVQYVLCNVTNVGYVVFFLLNAFAIFIMCSMHIKMLNLVHHFCFPKRPISMVSHKHFSLLLKSICLFKLVIYVCIFFHPITYKKLYNQNNECFQNNVHYLGYVNSMYAFTCLLITLNFTICHK